MARVGVRSTAGYEWTDVGVADDLVDTAERAGASAAELIIEATTLTADQLGRLARLPVTSLYVEEWPDADALLALLRTSMFMVRGGYRMDASTLNLDERVYVDRYAQLDLPGIVRVSAGGATALRLLPLLAPVRSATLSGANLHGQLGSAAAALPHLQRLELTDCALDDGDVPALVALLEAAPNLTYLNVSKNRFTRAGLERLPRPAKFEAEWQKPPPPPEWSAVGFTAAELREFGIDEFDDRVLFDWEPGTPLLRAWLSRLARHLLATCDAFDDAARVKRVRSALDRLEKAMQAPKWTTAMRQLATAAKGLQLNAPRTHAEQVFGELLKTAVGGIDAVQNAWTYRNAHSVQPSESQWAEASLDFEPDWLARLSEACVLAAGAAPNWNAHEPPSGWGDPAERERQRAELGSYQRARGAGGPR